MKKVVSSSLYERLGGKKALKAAVDIFYHKVLNDKSIAHFFESIDMTQERSKSKTFVAMALGARVKYPGKSLSNAHANLVKIGLNELHFSIISKHLEDTLNDLKVSAALIKEVMQVAGSTRNAILGIDKNKSNKSKQTQTMTKQKNDANDTLAIDHHRNGNNENIQNIDFTQVLEGSVLCVVMIDENGTIEFFNSAAEQLWGYKREEMLGENVKILTPGDIQLQHDSYLSSYNKTGKKNVMGGSREVQALRKDGTLVDILLSLSEAETDERKVYTAFVQDISEKKRIEKDAHHAMEELSAQEEELRQNMEEMQATQEEMSRKQIEMDGQMEAINSTSAFIEFETDGTIISANELFLQTMKYDLDEIKGQHHSIFVEEGYAKSKEYQQFWINLRNGIAQTGEYKRIAKDGSQVWLLANYTPVKDKEGKALKVIKLASDITVDKIKNANYQGQLDAIGKAQAIIEFNLDGTVITANDNFLNAMGYSLAELQGQHHSIFIEEGYKNSGEYKAFWKKLNEGQFESGEFKRIGKGGTEVWIQASYNPIFDINGVPFKVVKFATVVTEQKLQNANYIGQLTSVNKSYGVIEFNLDGTIINANDNFLNVVGYTLGEIQGKHHSMFVESETKNSPEYKAFWEKLNRGEFDAGTYRRVGKNNSECYIQATYNPILDLNGKPFKVVKYATDITEFTKALKAVSAFVGQLRDGNFEADIKITSEGDIGQMIQDNLKLRDTVKEIINDVNEVVRKAGNEGDLNARLNLTNTQGAWKVLVDSINLLLQSIAEPMLEFNAIISEMAKGDLTRKFEMQSKGDILDMAQSLNTAVENLNNLLFTIGENANVVADSSVNMLEKSEGIKNNTNEVASAISQMAKGAQDQASRTDESSKLVNEVLKTSEEMESKADIINKAAERGQQSCEEGMKIISRLVENMTGISDSASLTSESISILTQRAEEIGRTLNVITDIAAQTNLLALNAAIEAARAGDAGRGFAVVAEEIRKLAEDSRKSAVDIEKIIGDVQKDTQSAGKAIENMSGSVKEGNKASKEAETIFREIAGSSNETLSFSKEIKDATVLQKTSIDTVVKNIEQIVVVSEETAAGTQQVASSSQELNDSMEEISRSSNQLSEIAAELQAGVNQFKLTGTQNKKGTNK